MKEYNRELNRLIRLTTRNYEVALKCAVKYSLQEIPEDLLSELELSLYKYKFN